MDLVFGVDIASENFVSFNEERSFLKVENNAKGIAGYLKSLPEGAILAVESTGGYGKLLADKATAAGFTVYIVQPAKVKKFRESGPDRGKTDKIDARAIHDYLITYKSKLHPYTPMPSFETELRKLARSRDGLVRGKARLSLQMKSLGDSAKDIAVTLKGLTERIAKLDKRIADMLSQSTEAKRLSTICCVKAVVISAVLPALNTIPFKNKYSLDSFFGMDLMPKESGKANSPRRMSKQGDKYGRRALYMAAMSGVNSKVWKPYYAMLINVKKLPRVAALNALARKILHTIFGVYRSGESFAAPSWG